MQMLLIRWYLDPMHIEVNVAKNLIRHLYGKADSLAVCEDAQDVGLVRACWISPDGIKPDVPWALPKEILKTMNGMICEMKFPSHYGAGFRGCTSKHDFTPPTGLKSHDYHKLLHHVLPVVLQCCDNSPDRKLLRMCIYELCSLFR